MAKMEGYQEAGWPIIIDLSFFLYKKKISSWKGPNFSLSSRKIGDVSKITEFFSLSKKNTIWILYTNKKRNEPLNIYYHLVTWLQAAITLFLNEKSLGSRHSEELF